MVKITWLVLVFMTSVVCADEVLTFTDYVQIRSDTVLSELKAGGKLEDAVTEADAIFDLVVLYSPVEESGAFHRAAYLRRLMRQLAEVSEHVDARRYPGELAGIPEAAMTLAFLIRDKDEPVVSYGLISDLQAAYGERLNDYAELTAAFCVVHDQPVMRRVNENLMQAESPIELMKFYLAGEPRMLFGLKNVPAELLVYVVDNTATMNDMQWALKKYAGDRHVGRRFFDIRYDYTHYKTGHEKRVNEKGYSLPNLAKYGGVCADQAYFATTVGKSIGVPSVYTWGRSGEAGHAWVGFLQQRDGRAVWNFDIGRYDAFEKVRGRLEDPQTHEVITDSRLMLTGMLAGVKPYDRQVSVAMHDAAQRMAELGAEGGGSDSLRAILPPELATVAVEREREVPGQLSLIESGLRHCPANADNWLMIAELAKAGKLSLDQKQTWWKLLSKLCGDDYPDFVYEILVPMIETVDDLEARHMMWEQALRQFSRRSDLAAMVLIHHGLMWKEAGRYKEADDCFEQVIHRYANDGPFILDALRQRELLLYELGKDKHVPGLYTSTWKRIRRPSDKSSLFKKQSTWYQLGMLCILKLEEAGRVSDAEAVERELEREVR